MKQGFLNHQIETNGLKLYDFTNDVIDWIKRASKLGIKDLDKIYNINDMVKGDVIFCATGVTDGDLVKGIQDSEDYFQSESLVLHKSSKTHLIIKNKTKK